MTLELTVLLQVLEQLLRSQVFEGPYEDVGLVPEELVDHVLVLHLLKDFGGQAHDRSQGRVEEVRLESELDLDDVLPCEALVEELEEFLADEDGVDVLEADGEEHLAVAVQLLEHLGVAVLQVQEQLLNSFENLLFGLGGVDPLRQSVEHLFFVDPPVVFPSQVRVDTRDSLV